MDEKDGGAVAHSVAVRDHRWSVDVEPQPRAVRLDVHESLPMFPLNLGVFPGVTVPLHVFEDRYRALVHHLLRIEDPADRLFGTVAIREGYEVGDHGAQSLFRIGAGCSSPTPSPTRRHLRVVAVGRDRIQLDGWTLRRFPVGTSVDRPEAGRRSRPRSSTGPARRSRPTARRFSEIRGDPSPAASPATRLPLLDPGRPRPAADGRASVPARGRGRRRAADLVTDLLREELRAINVIPSLPATEVARTRWSPN